MEGIIRSETDFTLMNLLLAIFLVIRTIGVTVARDIAAKSSVLYGALCTEGKHDLQWLKS